MNTFYIYPLLGFGNPQHGINVIFPRWRMLYVLKQNLPHGAIQTGCLCIQEIHLSAIRKETPRGHVEPCYAINLNTRRYPEYFMIFLRHTRLLSNINHMSFFIFFILQLDPSLAPQPKRVFFDDTLSIIIIISVGRTHLGGHHSLCTWRSPQPDGICKVEL